MGFDKLLRKPGSANSPVVAEPAVPDETDLYLQQLAESMQRFGGLTEDSLSASHRVEIRNSEIIEASVTKKPLSSQPKFRNKIGFDKSYENPHGEDILRTIVSNEYSGHATNDKLPPE